MGLPEGAAHAPVRQLPTAPTKFVQVCVVAGLPGRGRAVLVLGASVPWCKLRQLRPHTSITRVHVCPFSHPPTLTGRPLPRRRTRVVCAAWSLSAPATCWPRVAWTRQYRRGTSTSTHTWPPFT
jgi:hypothetical protein